MQTSSAGPQFNPATLGITLPRPLPAFVTVSVGRMNVAVIDRLVVNVIVQDVPETASHPFHPVKSDPPTGAAVSVMTVPGSNGAEHVAPQSIPLGLDVTRPLTPPTTVRTGGGATVSVVLPLWPLSVAVIVADPPPMAVASPPAVIVATAGSLLVHVALIASTVVGVPVSAVVPMPSSPYVFIPQHFTMPP